MDLAILRVLLETPIIGLSSSNSHRKLSAVCSQLDLPEPPDEGTKEERIRASFESLPDSSLPAVAARLLGTFPLMKDSRHAIEDLLWSDDPVEIPKKHRREISRTIDITDLFLNAEHFSRLVDHLWILDDNPFAIFLEASKVCGQILSSMSIGISGTGPLNTSLNGCELLRLLTDDLRSFLKASRRRMFFRMKSRSANSRIL